jgi:hypothetical protein
MSTPSFSASSSASRPSSWKPGTRPGGGGGGAGTCTWEWDALAMVYENTSSDCNAGYVCDEAPMSYAGDTVVKDCVSS